MILVDTAVWIDHLHSPVADLVRLLESNMVLTHPWVVGEIALGSIANRRQVLSLLNKLPSVTTARTEELHALLNAHQLWSQGLGWVDLGLLASARLGHARLWTRDRQLAACAERIGVEIHA